ncbi:hypothetical protein TWF103_007607, partial [Orbilia oligospora]
QRRKGKTKKVSSYITVDYGVGQTAKCHSSVGRLLQTKSWCAALILICMVSLVTPPQQKQQKAAGFLSGEAGLPDESVDQAGQEFMRGPRDLAIDASLAGGLRRSERLAGGEGEARFKLQFLSQVS